LFSQKLETCAKSNIANDLYICVCEPSYLPLFPRREIGYNPCKRKTLRVDTTVIGKCSSSKRRESFTTAFEKLSLKPKKQ
jgi:hypothetical protein